MPGINDAHVHFLRGSLRLTQLDLNGARSLEEIQARLARFAKDNPPAAGNPWIQGYGWQYTVMPGGRLPTRQDLDTIVADRPIFLAAYDGHTGWANSAALALARVDGRTTFSGWGEIVKDARGEPTGVFKEQAQSVIAAVVPVPSHDEQRAALRRGIARAAALGITSIQNAHGSPEDVALFQEAAAAGELSLRVGVAQTLRPPVPEDRIAAIQALAARSASGPVRVKAVKIVVDGVIEAHTAAMLAPYTDEPGTSGPARVDPGAARPDGGPGRSRGPADLHPRDRRRGVFECPWMPTRRRGDPTGAGTPGSASSTSKPSTPPTSRASSPSRSSRR